MAAIDLTDITAQTEGIEGVVPSVVFVFGEFQKELARLGALPTVDPAEIAALAARLGAEKQKIADAVAANPDPNPND